MSDTISKSAFLEWLHKAEKQVFYGKEKHTLHLVINEVESGRFDSQKATEVPIEVDDESIVQVYFRIKGIVQKVENFIPRTYQTVGGMWTTDTYKFGGVTVQVMDEGYSSRIVSESLDVTERYYSAEKKSKLSFAKGSAVDLNQTLAELNRRLKSRPIKRNREDGK